MRAVRRQRDRIPWWDIGSLGVLALAARLGYWLGFTANRPLTSDAAQYNFLAANLAAGKGYVDTYPQLHLHATAFRPPVFPAFLAVFYWVFGTTPGLGRLVNVLVGVAVVLLAYLTVRRSFPRRAALAAGLAVAVSPNLVANDTFTLNESLALVLLLVLLNSLISERWLIAGVLTGGLILTRPSAQYLVIVLALWIIVRTGWRAMLTYVALAAVVVTPWLIRNWAQLGQPVLVTSNGYNWAALYSPPARKVNAYVDPLSNSYFDFMRLDQFDEVKWSSHLQRIAFTSIRADPWQVPKVVARNAAAFFEFKPSFNGGAEAEDGRSRGVRAATLWIFYAELLLGLTGLWLARHDALGLLVSLQAAYFAVASFVLIAAPRLRAPVDLALAIGTGVAVDRGLAWWARGRDARSARRYGRDLTPTGLSTGEHSAIDRRPGRPGRSSAG